MHSHHRSKLPTRPDNSTDTHARPAHIGTYGLPELAVWVLWSCRFGFCPSTLGWRPIVGNETEEGRPQEGIRSWKVEDSYGLTSGWSSWSLALSPLLCSYVMRNSSWVLALAYTAAVVVRAFIAEVASVQAEEAEHKLLEPEPALAPNSELLPH